jgi:hypothetical protein
MALQAQRRLASNTVVGQNAPTSDGMSKSPRRLRAAADRVQLALVRAEAKAWDASHGGKSYAALSEQERELARANPLHPVNAARRFQFEQRERQRALTGSPERTDGLAAFRRFAGL